MTSLIKKITDQVTNELSIIWAAHNNVGLDGYMCLYTNHEQIPFRSKEAGISFWFNKNETEAAISKILEHYNNGRLPNSPLLLNPVVHKKNDDETYTPLGSGIIWCTGLILGIDVLNNESLDRLNNLGIFTGMFERGGNEQAGVKALGFCKQAQPPKEGGRTVTGCKELFEITHISSDQYGMPYFLSGIAYLTNNGLFEQTNLDTMFPKNIDIDINFINNSAINIQDVFDAAECWRAYEYHHSLYKKFGTNVKDIERNLHFFNLVARDVSFFDATGPQRVGADEKFEFIVPGWIPRGAITLLAATGGTGKSSVAHHLCVLAAMDHPPGEPPPKWLGQEIDLQKCKGVSIYFSGEDGPAIVNARAAMFDPEGYSRRLMFQRTDFGEGVSFAQQMKNLHKIPDVPVVVIDPARKYLTGDENDAGVVSDFFEAIEEFAIQKKAAVLVVHHLQKGANPKSAREVLDMLRGSQVFIDRPRVVIGMYRDGPYTVVGLAKNNIPPNLGMVSSERVFARDPKRLSLVWLPGAEGVRNAPLTEEELEEIANKAREGKH